jgi:hypothetical protein
VCQILIPVGAPCEPPPFKPRTQHTRSVPLLAVVELDVVRMPRTSLRIRFRVTLNGTRAVVMVGHRMHSIRESSPSTSDCNSSRAPSGDRRSISWGSTPASICELAQVVSKHPCPLYGNACVVVEVQIPPFL